MRTQAEDTSPEVERIMIEGWRAMTPARKLQVMESMRRMVDELALADIRAKHPDETDREHSLRLASRWMPADLMRRAFGWNPDEKGY